MTRKAVLLFSLLLCCVFAFAAPERSTERAPQVPRMIKFSGTIANAQGTIAVTFALYKDSTGGAPLWLETQNVLVDEKGRFAIYLGADHAHGVPADLFASGEARWLGVQPEGQPEQARVLLVSVPYALKAADADTLGGHRLSEFVLAGAKDAALSSTDYVNATAIAQAAYAISGAVTNALPKFTSTAGDMSSSAIYEANGNLGIGTSTPGRALHIKSGSPTIRIEDTHFPNSFWELQQSAYMDDWFGFLRYDTSQGSFGAVPVRSLIMTNDGKFGLGVPSAYANITEKVNIGPGNLKLWGTAGADGVIFPDGTKQITAFPGSAAFLTSVTATPNSGVTATTAAGGKVTLNTDTAVLQKRVASGCTTGAISQINQDGSVNCVTVSSGGTSTTNPSQFINLYGDQGLDDPANVGFTAARLITDQPITVTKVSVTAADPGQGTCTPALARVSNGTVYEDVPIGVGTTNYTTPDHALVFPANSTVTVSLVTPAYCGPNNYYGPVNYPPQMLSGMVRYRVANPNETTSCPAGLTASNGSCVDLNNDPQNCGGAGNSCAGKLHMVGTCSNATCGTGTCQSGYFDCDNNQANGCETNLTNDSNNCGGCGNMCPVGPTTNGTGTGCKNYQCQVTCNPGFATCFSAPCSINLMSDVYNCGACNNVCANGSACVQGACVSSAKATGAIIVNPSTVTVGTGTGGHVFTATAVNSSTPGVIWSVAEGAAGGTVSGGIYTAPSTAGTYHVLATSSTDSGKIGSATVNVVTSQNAEPVFTSVPPTSASEGVQYNYSATATCNGSSTGVNYTLTAGPPNSSLYSNTVMWSPYSSSFGPTQVRVPNLFILTATCPSGTSASQTWAVIPTGTVNGVRRYTFVKESGDTTTTAQNMTYTYGSAALIPNADSTYTTINGSGTVNGTFSIPNVPGGNYLFKYWNGSSFVWTDTSNLDMSYVNQGRSDLYSTAPGTTLVNTVSGLLSTQADDTHVITVPDVNCLLMYPYSGAGITSDQITIPWTCGFVTPQDNIYVMQLATAMGNGHEYAVVKKMAGPVNMTMTNGVSNPLQTTLTDLPLDHTVRLNLAASQFAALRSDMTSMPIDSSYSGVWLVVQNQVEDRGTYGVSYGYPLTAMANGGFGTDVDFGNLAYGLPQNAPAPYIGYQEVLNVAYTAPGATNPYVLQAIATANTTVMPTATSPLTPIVGPVKNAKVEGLSLMAPQTISTLRPTISWQPPSVGTANGYQITLIRLSNVNGNTTTSSTVFYTTDTKLVLPANVLVPGYTYVVRIYSFSTPSDLTKTPLQRQLPLGWTTTLSAPLTVSSNATGSASGTTASQVANPPAEQLGSPVEPTVYMPLRKPSK